MSQPKKQAPVTVEAAARELIEGFYEARRVVAPERREEFAVYQMALDLLQTCTLSVADQLLRGERAALTKRLNDPNQILNYPRWLERLYGVKQVLNLINHVNLHQ